MLVCIKIYHFRHQDIESLGSTSALTSAVVTEAERNENPEVELETPQMTVWTTLCLLAVVTAVSYLLYIR